MYSWWSGTVEPVWPSNISRHYTEPPGYLLRQNPGNVSGADIIRPALHRDNTVFESSDATCQRALFGPVNNDVVHVNQYPSNFSVMLARTSVLTAPPCPLARPDYVTNARIHDNIIKDCGIHDFIFDDGGKTGEGVCECTRESVGTLSSWTLLRRTCGVWSERA